MPGERIVESFGAACSRFLRSFKLFEPELPPGVVWKKKDPRKDYKFGPELGHGNYGAVHSVTHIQSGRVAACKVVRKDGTSYQRSQIITEVAALHSVDSHPNVATLYEVYETPTYFYLCMEPCLGGELFDVIISRGHFSERDAAVVMHVILDVIRFCHTHGITHRDFKPENFLLKRKALDPTSPLRAEDLRAVDFGLATFLEPGGRLKELLGSPFYVAPELLRGNYSHPADVWAAGVILYILLSGMPPFSGANEREVFRCILRQRLDLSSEPWPSISKHAKDLVAGLLERDPGKRLTPAQALQHQWLRSAVSDSLLHSNLVMDRLKEFSRMTKLQGLLMNVIAKNLSTDSIVSLKEAFNALDTDGDGYLSFEELRQGLDAASGNSVQCSEAAKAVMQALDVSGDGSIEYHEFLAAVVDRQRTLTDQTLAEMFAYLDKNGDGTISPQELSDALAECDIQISKDSLLQLMANDLPRRSSKQPQLTSEAFVELLRGSLKSESIRFSQLEDALSDMRRSFGVRNRFRQLALLVIARTTPSSELEGLQELFERLDVDHSGCLSLGELRRGLKAIDNELSDDEIEELLEFMDVDGNNRIDYHEFVIGILEDKQLLTEAKLHAAFNYFDTDRNGLIDIAEVEAVVRGLDIKLSQSPTELLALADSNEDQVVDFSEFREMMLAAEPNILTSRKQSLQLRRSDTSTSSAASSFSATTTMALEALEKPLKLRSELQSPYLAGRSGSLPRSVLAEAVGRDLAQTGPGLETAIAEVRRESLRLQSAAFAGDSADIRKALREGSKMSSERSQLEVSGVAGAHAATAETAEPAGKNGLREPPLMSVFGQGQLSTEANSRWEPISEDVPLPPARARRRNLLGPPRASMPVVSTATRTRSEEEPQALDEAMSLASSGPSGSLPPILKSISAQGQHDRSVRWSDEDGKSLTSDVPRRRRPQHVFLKCVGQQKVLRSWGSSHLDDDALLARLANGEPADSLGGVDSLAMTAEGHNAREAVQGGGALNQTAFRPQNDVQKAASGSQAAKVKKQRGEDGMKGLTGERTDRSDARPGTSEGSSQGGNGKTDRSSRQSHVRGATVTPPESVWANRANSLADAPNGARLSSSDSTTAREAAHAAEIRASRAQLLTRRDTEPLRDVIADMEDWWSRTSLLAKQRTLPGQPHR